jgi:hypothetical protein
MGNEISFTGSLSVYKPSVMSGAMGRAIVGALFSMTGSTYVEQVAVCGNAGTLLLSGNVGQPHWAFFNSPYASNGPGNALKTITGAANNGSGLVRITATSHGYITGDVVSILGVTGTTEANAFWPITVITANTFDLVGSTFTNAYVSGGSAYLQNTIRIRNGSGGADLIQLFPGEVAFLPLPLGCAPYAMANIAGQVLEYLIVSY